MLLQRQNLQLQSMLGPLAFAELEKKWPSKENYEGQNRKYLCLGQNMNNPNFRFTISSGLLGTPWKVLVYTLYIHIYLSISMFPSSKKGDQHQEDTLFTLSHTLVPFETFFPGRKKKQNKQHKKLEIPHFIQVFCSPHRLPYLGSIVSTSGSPAGYPSGNAGDGSVGMATFAASTGTSGTDSTWHTTTDG